MIEWTQPARALSQRLLESQRQRYAAQGADASEVVADLQAHLDEEIRRLGLHVVTEEDVRRILAAIDPELIQTSTAPTGPSGPPEPPRTPSTRSPAPVPRSDAAPAPAGPPGRLASFLYAVFGILLPLATLLFEVRERLCAAEIFDPIPTWFHLGAILLVPLAVLVGLIRFHGPDPVPSAWQGWLVALATGVAAHYALILLPLSPAFLVGIVYFGIGLLPLAPLIGWILLLFLGRRLHRAETAAGLKPRRTWPLAVGAFLALWLAMVPETLTLYWAHAVAQEAEPQAGLPLRMLRRFGSESVLLRACYGTGASVQRALGLPQVSEADARSVYFRTTGRAFNEVRPPLSPIKGSGRWLFRELEWDSDLGGEAVGGLVTGLSLMTSRLDAMAHAGDGWSYTEWTFEFRNDHESSQREARAILQLPSGGVVSRVTLWIDGEEREAAFGGRSQVRAAYREVAVAKRRDPILVTTAGADRVLMQCFPVPPNGGVMRVRVGITAPLEALGVDDVAFLWPRIADRNFAIRDSLRHHAWLEVPDGAPKASPEWIRDAERPQSLHATAPQSGFEQRFRPIRLGRDPRSSGAWVGDDRSSEPSWIRSTLEENRLAEGGRIAVVVDGGLRARPLVEPLIRALRRADVKGTTGRFALWFARDGARRWPGKSQPASSAELADALEAWSEGFDGGHDPFPALQEAWDWAAAEPAGAVLWVHGVQPLAFPDSEGIVQRLNRSSGRGSVLVDITDVAAPDRATEGLPESPLWRRMPRVESLEDDLVRLLGEVSARRPVRVWNRVRTTSDPGSVSDAGPASRHLVRLWARDAVTRLLEERKRDEAVALAAKWQLVTPVSGAVVLETKEQYDRHGLAAVDPATAPGVVPEPETWALLLAGATLVLWQAGRRRRKG
jgi:hypothetical protein